MLQGQVGRTRTPDQPWHLRATPLTLRCRNDEKNYNCLNSGCQYWHRATNNVRTHLRSPDHAAVADFREAASPEWRRLIDHYCDVIAGRRDHEPTYTERAPAWVLRDEPNAGAAAVADNTPSAAAMADAAGRPRALHGWEVLPGRGRGWRQ